MIDHSPHLWSESPAGIYFSVLNRLQEVYVWLMHTQDMRDWMQRGSTRTFAIMDYFYSTGADVPTHDLRTMEESKRQQGFNSNIRFMLLQSSKAYSHKAPCWEVIFVILVKHVKSMSYMLYESLITLSVDI